ncbi:MAG TPA: Hsp20/alpha crystallin family protein [Acidiferrobacterales bacterium]|jgi:HSP20 family protein
MSTLMRSPNRGMTNRWGDDIDSLFEGFFRPLRWAEEDTAEAGIVPRLDVTERDNEFVVHAEMPGVNKDDINITLEGGILTISGESKSDSEQKEGDRVIRRERRYGRYVRSLQLGKEVDDKKVRASYKDGILELTLPKAEEVKPKRITVDVK